MTLLLDARQRAMLLEMGVRIWHAPGYAARVTPEAPVRAARTSSTAEPTPMSASSGHGAPVLPNGPATAAPRRTDSQPPVLRAQATAAAGDALPASAPAHGAHGAHGSWSLQPMRLLYPAANPELAPTALGAGWLLVTQAVDAAEPWAERAEKLQAAMLQALQLHLHPRVALCALQSGAPGTSGSDDITAEIATQVAAFAPSVVLVMGRGAVRAALGLTEPLAKLREQDLRIAGVPVVATYDAPFLLRNPQCKRPAWADLCRARELSGISSA